MTAAAMVVVEHEERVRDLRDTVSTHFRIVARVQGKRDGWFFAVDDLLSRAAAAFKTGDDRTANMLRDLARELSAPGHPRLLAFTEDERNSLEMIEVAKTKLAEMGEEAYA